MALTTFVSAHGPQGVFLGMLLESAGVPVPSEAVLPFAGWLAATGRWSFGEAVAVALLGQLAGSLLAYGIGYVGGRPAVEAIDRWTGGHHLAPTERWFQARGHWAVFWGRFLPVVRTYISFPAGIGAMPVSRFVAYSLLGAIPWTVVLTWIGLRFGRGANLTASITHVLYAVLVLVALAAGLTLWVRRQA